jgi:hypothetical protein
VLYNGQKFKTKERIMSKNGWKNEGGGWYSGEKLDPALTEEFTKHAERQRARYDILIYLETILKQKIETGKHPIASFFYKILVKFNKLFN